jgi:16S rRNA (guanine527-N7)-methyltransferase
MSENTPIWTEQDFADQSNVPRGTLLDYVQWYGLLRKWNARINLVAAREIDHFWHRHAYDSWQLNAHLPQDWTTLVDLGSGGGFPGLALGIYAKQIGVGVQATPKSVHLVESIGKKTSFLKTVARELKLPVTVHTARIEDLPPLGADVMTARAFAPLPKLFDYAAPHLKPASVLILPKGETANKEIEEARKHWLFDVEAFKSVTESSASILRVVNLRRKP